MRILVIDNYDSFTYNLVQYVEEVTGERVEVFRNNEIALEQIEKYQKIILSPGPGIPSEAGLMPEIIKNYADKKRFLGVCLGHQAIAESFGAELVNYNQVYHGIASETIVLEIKDELFKDIPKVFLSGRYHAWGVKRENLPDCFTVTAEDDEGNIMAINHKEYDVKGVQFHPESVLTEHGITIIKNWLNY